MHSGSQRCIGLTCKPHRVPRPYVSRLAAVPILLQPPNFRKAYPPNSYPYNVASTSHGGVVHPREDLAETCCGHLPSLLFISGALWGEKWFDFSGRFEAIARKKKVRISQFYYLPRTNWHQDSRICTYKRYHTYIHVSYPHAVSLRHILIMAFLFSSALPVVAHQNPVCIAFISTVVICEAHWIFWTSQLTIRLSKYHHCFHGKGIPNLHKFHRYLSGNGSHEIEKFGALRANFKLYDKVFL